MSGIASNEHLLPREHQKLEQKKTNIKLFCCLLITNTLTFLLTHFNQPSAVVPTPPIRPEHAIIRWPLVNLTASKGIIAVTLLHNGSVVLPKVYLHNHKSIGQRDREHNNDGGNTRLQSLEVPRKALKRLLKYKGKVITALPYTKFPSGKKQKKEKQRGLREIIF